MSDDRAMTRGPGAGGAGGGGPAGGHPGGPPSGPEAFDRMYEGVPSWDLGRPQPAVIRAAKSGLIAGDVLDVGCGTGQDARWLAGRGHAVVGIDFSPRGIERAQAGPPTSAEFFLADALDLAAAGIGPKGRTFDSALDVGCFHSIAVRGRARYSGSVRDALRPGGRLVLLCWSDRNIFAGGPARLSRDEIQGTFADGWTIESIEPEVLESPRAPGEVLAWLAVLHRA